MNFGDESYFDDLYYEQKYREHDRKYVEREKFNNLKTKIIHYLDVIGDIRDREGNRIKEKLRKILDET